MTCPDLALSLAKLWAVRLWLPVARFLSLPKEQIQLCYNEPRIAYLKIQNPQASIHNALKKKKKAQIVKKNPKQTLSH